MRDAIARDGEVCLSGRVVFVALSDLKIGRRLEKVFGKDHELGLEPVVPVWDSLRSRDEVVLNRFVSVDVEEEVRWSRRGGLRAHLTEHVVDFGRALERGR